MVICVGRSRQAHWNINKLALHGNMGFDVVDVFWRHCVVSQYECDPGADYKESV